MKIVGIIQARINSSRLPRKVMLKLGPKIVLDHVVSRLRECKLLNKVVVATSITKNDDEIAHWCKQNKTLAFRGSEHDVLDRYYRAMKTYKADIVVRITADCPLIDPDIVDQVIEGFLDGNYDGYALGGNFPDGLDCQVFSMNAIEKAWEEARMPSDREHVGSYIENTNPSSFNLGTLELFDNLQFHRWTLDEQKDYEFLEKVITKVYAENKKFRTKDILNFLSKHPELININNNIERNEGYWNQRNNE